MNHEECMRACQEECKERDRPFYYRNGTPCDNHTACEILCEHYKKCLVHSIYPENTRASDCKYSVFKTGMYAIGRGTKYGRWANEGDYS